MVEQKLDAMLAQEKLRASGDAIYHVLADTIVILKTAYREAGAERPVRQVREEAMDLMLQTVSGDNQEVSRDFSAARSTAIQPNVGFVSISAGNDVVLAPCRCTEYSAYYREKWTDNEERCCFSMPMRQWLIR